jgi:hypothetical protein
VSDWFKPPTPVAAAVQGVCAAPLYVTLAGQLSVTVEDTRVMLQEPATGVIAKLAKPSPPGVGVTVPDPASGPTEDGLFVQVRLPVKAPLTAHAGEVECGDASYAPL